MRKPPPLPPTRRANPHPSGAAGRHVDARERDSTSSTWLWIVALALLAFLLLLCFVAGVGIWLGTGRGTATGGGSGGANETQNGGGLPLNAGDSTTTNSSDAGSAEPAAPPDTDYADEYREPTTNDGADPPLRKKDTPLIDGPLPGSSVAPDLRKRGQSVAGGTFFGIRAKGKRFVYVIDCSSSMQGRPFERAKEELFTSLKELSKSQAFFVIFYSSESFPMFHPNIEPNFVVATDGALTRTKVWLQGFPAHGGTDPAPALQHALSMAPDAVFFLTDGQIPPNTEDSVRLANTDGIPIHTICFTNQDGEAVLRSIATENHGTYLFVP